MKKKRAAAIIAAVAVILALVQLGRYAGTYPVSPLPSGKGVGSTLYVASCEPYHPYLEEQESNWFYLFQAPLDGEDFDGTLEKIIYTGGSTHMNTVYQIETYRVSADSQGAMFISQETALLNVQKKMNVLAPKTSEDNPLYLVWCGGNLYGVAGERAYLLWRGSDGKRMLLSLPEFEKTQHSLRVIELGPITEDDYYESPATPS